MVFNVVLPICVPCWHFVPQLKFQRPGECLFHLSLRPEINLEQDSLVKSENSEIQSLPELGWGLQVT